MEHDRQEQLHNKIEFEVMEHGLVKIKTKEWDMKVNDLINILIKHPLKNEVVFYYLENHNLQRINLETILDADNQTEITVTFEEVTND